MSAELLAIGTALAFAIGAITTRFALNKHPSAFSALITFASATAILWGIVIVKGYEIPQNPALMLFALRGVIDPGIVAFLFYVGFRRLGISITVPIIAAAPLISTSLAVIFLNEAMTLPILVGTLLIVGGVVLLTFKPSKIKFDKKYVFFAIAGTILIGISAIITKMAIDRSDSPIGGVTISFTVGLLVQVIIIAALRKFKELPRSSDAIKAYLLVGIFVAAAFVLYHLAFAAGSVSVVFPLIAVQPFFVLLLTRIFLKKHEVITKNIIIGTVLIVAGAVLLTAF